VEVDKSLSEKAKDKYNKQTDKLTDLAKDLTERIAESASDKYKEFVPNPVRLLASKHNTELAAMIAEFQLMLEDGWVGVASEIETRVKPAIKEASTSNDRLNKLLRDADKMIAG